jgi:hypothetical protein
LVLLPKCRWAVSEDTLVLTIKGIFFISYSISGTAVLAWPGIASVAIRRPGEPKAMPGAAAIPVLV